MLNRKSPWRYQILCDIFYDDPQLRELLANPDSVLHARAEILKNDLKTTIGTLDIAGKRVIIKRYNIVNRQHAIRRYLVPSRARVCWQAAHLLLSAGIKTPQPIAMIEKRWGLLRSTSYYIHEYISGMHAGDYFTAQHKAGSWPIVAARIAELIQKLQQHKLSHGDLKVTNIIIAGQKPVLIDLDDTRQHWLRYFANRALKKDLWRFMNYWQQNSAVKELFTRAFQLLKF